MRSRHLAIVALVTVLLVAGADRVLAQDSVGAGISAAPVALGQPARPGTTYDLPVVTVANTGAQRTTYAVAVRQIAGQREVPTGWIQVDPAAIDLDTGQQATVHLSLQVPAEADTGDYHALLEARAVTGTGTGAGGEMGVAAATDLRFSVTPSDGAGTTGPGAHDPTSRWVPDWALLLVAVVVALGLLGWLLYRAGFSISVERRP